MSSFAIQNLNPKWLRDIRQKIRLLSYVTSLPLMKERKSLLSPDSTFNITLQQHNGVSLKGWVGAAKQRWIGAAQQR